MTQTLSPYLRLIIAQESELMPMLLWNALKLMFAIKTETFNKVIRF